MYFHKGGRWKIIVFLGVTSHTNVTLVSIVEVFLQGKCSSHEMDLRTKKNHVI